MSNGSRLDNGRCVTEHFERSIAELERIHGEVPRREMLAMFQIMATHDLLSRLMSATVESQGLSFAAFRVLAMISKEKGKRLPMHRLSEWLSVSRQNVTGLIDGLEKRALVSRSTCESDRRVKWVALTAEGESVLRGLAPRNFALVRALMGGLDEAQVQALTDTLATIRERVLTKGPELEPTFSLASFLGCSGPPSGEVAPPSAPSPSVQTPPSAVGELDLPIETFASGLHEASTRTGGIGPANRQGFLGAWRVPIIC
jgi:DNA-binding MarR family transcriptional regulator